MIECIVAEHTHTMGFINTCKYTHLPNCFVFPGGIGGVLGYGAPTPLAKLYD
jgi:hypothetical protein